MSSAPCDPVNNFETNAGTFRVVARPTARPDAPRRVLDIEDALRWAFRDELPKDRGDGGAHGPGGYRCPLGNIGALGTRVDCSDGEPGFPAALGGPHPDALKIEAAVERLADMAGQVVDTAPDLVPDFGPIGPLDEVAAVRNALRMMPGIVARCARTGRRPPWEAKTYPERIEAFNGRPLVSRWRTVAKRTHDDREVEEQELLPVTASGGANVYPWDSFCPLIYAPTLQSIADERAEYLVWFGALDHLALDLAGELETIAALPPLAPQRPWCDEGRPLNPPLILNDREGRAFRRQGRETAEAHRMLGARRDLGGRGAVGRAMVPRRVVPAVARRARA